VLTVRGRGRLTSPEGYRLVHAEYGEGDYERVFTLSQEIDEAAVQAEFAHGVLTLTLPRAEASKPRRIEVKAG
jgi:HSP20 family molecular chaperone IbpA